MIEQLELGSVGPRVSAEDPRVDDLIELLRGQGWRTARQIDQARKFQLERRGLPGNGWSDRLVRALAHESAGLIIIGNKGYCLLAESTPEEIAHAAARLRSQGQKMIERSIEILRVYHQLGAKS